MYSRKSIDAFAELVTQRSRLPKHGSSRKVILVEHHSIYRQHIPYILLSRALARHHGAEPVLFRVDNKVARSRVPKFLRRLKDRADVGSTGRLFRACGLSRNLHLNDHAERFLKRAGEITERELVGATLQNLERYELQGVPIGDLLYDDFLAMGHTTIDTNSHDFFLHAKSFIASALAWHSYFLRCHVMAVVTNHVYRQGVPARIANYSGIDTFEAGLHRVARISREQPALSESSNFREVFEGLEESQQGEALRSADRIIEEITARGVPCYVGSCSEIYLEKAFDNTGWRPVTRLPVAKALGETSIMFLVHPTLTDLEIRKTQEVIREVLAKASGLTLLL
jgi:hypothetical protein